MCDDYAVEGAGVSPVSEESSGFGEVWDTGDASVFFVELGLDDFLFGSAYGWENVWLSLVVAVCANTYVIVSECWTASVSNYIPKLIFSLFESALKASVIPVYC